MNSTKTVLCLLLVSQVGMLHGQPNVTAWNILKEGANDKNPERRKEAMVAIGSIGLDPEAIKLTESTLLNDEDPVVRQTAAATLGVMKSTQSIPALQKALDDAYGQVAFQAAKTLWDMGDRTCRGTLQEILTGDRKDNTGFVDGAMRDAKAKLHSPRALAKIGIKEASGALLGPFSLGVSAATEMMKDGGAPGRAFAATLLGQDCDERAHQLLEYSLKNDKNAAVKAAAARGLGQCGNKDSIVKLEEHLSDGRDAVKFMAAAAIVKLSMTGK
jgi:HEAT repeat protein